MESGRGRWTGSSSASPTPHVGDFSSLNFGNLWRGRERTTEVERSLLALTIGRLRYRRALEIGCGEGRLSPVVQSAASEYIGLDLTPRFVARVPDHQNCMVIRAAGNVYELPFADQSFDVIVMVRVYNFLESPDLGLKELFRVLAPGGRLILTYNPKPSLGTLTDDLKSALRRTDGPPRRPMSFSRPPTVPVHPSEFPAWAPTRLEFERILRQSGFDMEAEFPCGLEDYVGLRRLPSRLFVGLARLGSEVGAFPTRFVAARRPGGPSACLPPLERLWRCPRCLGDLHFDGGLPSACPRCRIPTLLSDGVIDARCRGPRDRAESGRSGIAHPSS